MWAALDYYADFFAANFSFHGAMAQMSAGTLCSMAASRPKTNETAAAAAKMPMALLDLDFLGLMRPMRGAASSGIVLSVLVILSVVVNRFVAGVFYAVL